MDSKLIPINKEELTKEQKIVESLKRINMLLYKLKNNSYIPKRDTESLIMIPDTVKIQITKGD